jgi:hypothetical protein
MNDEPVVWTQNTFCSKCHRIPSQCCCSSVKELTDEEYKPLTEADVPYQKVVSKEITDEIGKALGLKTLTDEEIKSEAKYFCHSWHSQNPERLVLFARAILKKAQEK